MNILLLQPPISDFYQTKVRLQPLGLAYLKASAKIFFPNINIEIHDLQSGYKRRSIPIPKNLSYLKEYYKDFDNSPFSTFHHYYRFGATDDEIMDIVKSNNWDLIGISSLFTPYYSDVKAMIKLIKSRCKIPIVIGGGHPSAVAEEILEDPNLDFIIRGEGERPFVELLEMLHGTRSTNEVANLCYKDNRGQIQFNDMKENYPLEDIPHPDIKELGARKYLHQNRPIAFMMSSRACPHHCNFCSAFQVFGRRYRQRSNSDIIAEIDQRVREGFKVIDFEDDNLTFNHQKALELFQQITNNNYDLELMAMNGISYRGLDHKILMAMKEAGFRSINISLVSSDNQMIKDQKRPHDNEEFNSVVENAFSLGLSITSYIILGLPKESLPQMINSIIKLAKLPVLIGASIFYLIPGTPIEDEFENIDYEDFTKCRLTAMAFIGDHYTREDIYTLFVTCRIINFIKSFELNDNSTLNDILVKNHPDTRIQKGCDLLYGLLKDKKWHHDKFKHSTFEIVWKDLEQIQTQGGSTITIA